LLLEIYFWIRPTPRPLPALIFLLVGEQKWGIWMAKKSRGPMRTRGVEPQQRLQWFFKARIVWSGAACTTSACYPCLLEPQAGGFYNLIGVVTWKS
jgi:hypothetical protein